MTASPDEKSQADRFVEDSDPATSSTLKVESFDEDFRPGQGQGGIFSVEDSPPIMQAKATHNIARVITWSVLVLYGVFAVAFIAMTLLNGGSSAQGQSQDTSFLMDAGMFLAPLHTVLAAVAGFYFGSKQE